MATTLCFEHYPIYAISILISSFLFTFLIIPSIIHVARNRHLYDDQSHSRKIHTPGISRLGGIAIFISFVITLLLFGTKSSLFPFNYLLISCILLFTIGIKDDLTGVGYLTKFTIQFLAAFIVVVPGNIRIQRLDGLLGIDLLQNFSCIVLSILTIIFIVNSFNLIDGIDGLAATIGIVANTAFSILFIYIQQYEIATISLSLVGALLGFIKFNLSPAKIFMGDTGALLIGLISAVMAIEFVRSFPLQQSLFPETRSALGIVTAILIIPISDTIRIVVIRLSKGKSPFKADRNHIHHLMLKLGFTPLQVTFILALINIILILVTFLFS
ncbi:MraY family glycosyltransferase [Pedobacter nyackensis]|uniref:MraY family glycosyltransferase n=1 Tax=Pedobacter nyackensis TaxID=475255 RepID=UPI00292FDA16|nr:MraY family glycosyltransferase [Pedobacter nyackensis]